MIDIRRIRRRVLLGGIPLAMLACGMLGGPAAAQQPAGQVTIALAASVSTLDPHTNATVASDLSVISHLYSSLVIRGPDLQLRPSVARSWRAVDDNTWRFELVPGITFPNGEALDAAAVKWNIERVLDPQARRAIRSWFEPIQEVRVVSPTVVEMVTRTPYPALPDQLSTFFLLPPQWSQTNNPARAAMGTGPYVMREFVAGDRIVLEARPNYWGEAPPFSRVVFRVIPEASSRVAAVLTGEVDMTISIPPSDIPRINASGRARAGAVPTVRSMFVKFNTLRPPFQGNIALRQALNYAIDRQAIINSVLSGLTTESNCQVMTPGYFGYNPELRPYPYDPARARQLLREAGFPNGLEIEFEVPVGGYLLTQEIGQAIAAQLEEVGVRMRIVELEYNRWLLKYRAEGNLGQTAYLGQSWQTLDADGMLSLFEMGSPYAYWDDERFRDLLRQARQTTNVERRQAIFRQATEHMCREPPVLFLFSQPLTYATSNRVQWQARADDWVRAIDARPR